MNTERKKLYQEVKANVMVRVSVECTICGYERISDGNFCFDDAETELDEFQGELYDLGWRVFNSKEYGQVGLTCGDCIKQENK